MAGGDDVSRTLDDSDLDDLLGPSEPKPRTSREWQALARKERYSINRITDGPTSNKTRGRPLAPKCTQERMLAIVRQISKIPCAKDACEMNGVTTAGVRLWLTKSRLGAKGDGFDIVMNPEDDPDDQFTMRFHEAYDAALMDGADSILSVTIKRAMGYLEPLTYQGRVIYKLDPDAIRLGITEGPDAYLYDENGKPIPESVEKQDPDLMQFLLKGLKPEVFGNKTKVTLDGKVSGVLVVAQKAINGHVMLDEEAEYKKGAIDVEFEEVNPDEDA